MSFTVTCSTCQRHVTIPEESIGGPVTCPACGATFTAKQDQIGPSPAKEDQGLTPFSPPEEKRPLISPPLHGGDRGGVTADYQSQPERLGRQFYQTALRRIKAPANALLSAGIVSCVLGVLLIIIQGVMLWLVMRQNSEFHGMVVGPMGPIENLQIYISVAAILLQIVAIGLGIVIISGARSMKKLQGYRRSMTCSILSMLTVFMIGCPLSSCSLLGMPFGMWAVTAGIWSIIVLCKPEIKEAFRINELSGN